MDSARFFLTGLLVATLGMGCGRRPEGVRDYSEGGAAEVGLPDGVAANSAGNSGGGDGEVDSGPSGGGATDTRCDADADGAISLACGGDDCDDTHPGVHPGAVEYCNFLDDDCDGETNEDKFCGIYAHTSTRLLLIEPFVGAELEVGTVPGLLDFDTAPDGTLYGITSSALLFFDEGREEWESIGSFGEMNGSTNGFAISSSDSGYATSGNTLYRVELSVGSAVRIGEFGEDYGSSGDCVVNKSGRLFFSSDHDGAQDYLMEVDVQTGEAWPKGPIGFQDVYGLTFAWGVLFGFTDEGEVLRINPETGAGELLHVFPGRSFWGAASSPER